MRIGNVLILAGVPHIAARMLEALSGTLEGGRPMVSVTIGAYAAESEVADLLRETAAAHPGVAIGSYPFFTDGRYGANFVIRSEDGPLAEEVGKAPGAGQRRTRSSGRRDPGSPLGPRPGPAALYSTSRRGKLR